MRFAVLLAVLCACMPGRAHGQAFDGTWSVLQVCEATPEGARGYTWRYDATIKNNYFAGQYRNEGQVPSMSLRGTVQPDGTASLIAHGISASSDYNVKFAPPQTPIAFQVVAKFAGAAGTGERTSGRVCKFTFSKGR